MRKTSVRYSALALAVLGAGALLVLVATVVAAAPPLTTPPSSHTPALPSSPLTLSSSAPITLPDPSWRIGITEDGLYRLSYETLVAAGVPVTTTSPSAFHLLWRGQEVALQGVGTGDATFDPGDAFLFYAEKFHGSVQDEKYTDENVYWLAVYTTTPELRMGSRVVAPGGTAQPLAWYTATVRAEENLVYWARWSDTPGTSATWFWERVDTDVPVTRTYPITLVAPASLPYTATLLLEVAGRSYNDSVSPDHHLRLTVNDTTAGEVTWDGEVGAVFTLPVVSTALVSGVNQVKVTVLTDLSAIQDVYVDWVEIRYRRRLVTQDDVLLLTTPLSGAAAITLTGFSTSAVRLYDITHPLTPTRLVSATTFLSVTTYSVTISDTAPAGTAYLAVAEGGITGVLSPTVYHPPSDLIAPTAGADEIIVAPAAFLTVVQPLADLRRSQGLLVRVVDVDDIYAFFNGGVFHPEAIRAFVAHAYDNWPDPDPAYLLLVGDGNFNFKGYNPTDYGEFVPSLIPPYLEFADPDQGEVPVDSRYGDVDEDGMPEVMVGRIPAGSVAQAEGVVAKILAYESTPATAWAGRVLMAADNGYQAPEGFSQVLDNLAQDFVPAEIEVRTVYLEDYCGDPSPPYNTPCPSATLALTQTWNQGSLLLTYAGHAAVHRWAHEAFLTSTHLAGLTGMVGLPFLISLDCWDGYWMFPPLYPVSGAEDVRSIGEWATTVLTDRGAIAAFGPAGLAYIGPEEQMARAMYQALFEEGTSRLGPLTQAGREVISGTYLARTYTLFGDPAMRLAAPPHRVYLPLVLRNH